VTESTPPVIFILYQLEAVIFAVVVTTVEIAVNELLQFKTKFVSLMSKRQKHVAGFTVSIGLLVQHCADEKHIICISACFP